MNYSISFLFLLGSLTFISSYPIRSLTLEEYRKVTAAMYEALEVRGNINFWMQCLQNFIEEANENLKIAIASIQVIQADKILTLVKGLQHYKNFIANTIYDCRPCADFNKDPELKRLLKLISTINWQNIVNNLSKQFNEIKDNFVNTREYWNRQDLVGYGRSIAFLIRSCFED